MASGVAVVAYTFLLMGFIMCGISFFAPYWVFTVNEEAFEGLWGRCRNLEQDYEEGVLRFRCVWFLEDDYGWEKSKPVWHVACQMMNSIGIVGLFSMLVVGSIHACCTVFKRSTGVLKLIGVLLVLSDILLILSLGLFAGMSWRTEKTSATSQVSRFGWGLYLDIPGLILTALAAILYLVESCAYDGYERGPVDCRY